MAEGPVYLDWNATAPLRPEARQAVLAALAQPRVLAGIVLAAAELGPERTVLRTLPIIGLGEHRMMLPAHLVQGIPHRGEEILVGAEDAALQVELDHGL